MQDDKYRKKNFNYNRNRHGLSNCALFNIVGWITFIIIVAIALIFISIETDSHLSCPKTNNYKYPISLDGSLNYDRHLYKDWERRIEKHDDDDNSNHHHDDFDRPYPMSNHHHDDDEYRKHHEKENYVPLKVKHGYGKSGLPYGRYIDRKHNGYRSAFSCENDTMHHSNMEYEEGWDDYSHDWEYLNPRRISNIVNYQGDRDIPSKHGLNALWIYWGQFLDHMIVLTKTKEENSYWCLDIPDYDNQTMKIKKSKYTMDENGQKEQINFLSSYVHADTVYGNNKLRLKYLRSGYGGKLVSTNQNSHIYIPSIKTQLPPFNKLNIENEPSTSEEFYLCGDVRCNENIVLLSFHSLFLREHNYWAEHYSKKYSKWGDDEIFHKARKRVIAEIQYITYEEFLPALLGKDVWHHDDDEERCYDEYIDSRIYTEFSTAAYRFGHTCIPGKIEYRDEYEGHYKGSIGLFDSFFNPSLLKDGNVTVGELLLGIYHQSCQEIDVYISDAMRNTSMDGTHLDFDIAAFNILRGRADHSLPNYVTLRWKMGGKPVTDWYDISSDHEIVHRLKQAYGEKGWDKLDAWVGLLAEDHKYGASIGRTAWKIIRDQFYRLKYGDYYFYLWDKSNEDYLSDIHGKGTLKDVIIRNTYIGEEYLHKDIFHVPNFDKKKNHESSPSSDSSSDPHHDPKNNHGH